MRIRSGDATVLLPGDIERGSERALLAAWARGRDAPDRLRADLLVAPHHGSQTSSTQAFIDAVQPHYVVYAVGFRNRFGFPRPEVQRRYARAGARAWCTDRAGAVTFTWSQSQQRWSVRAQRDSHARFWHWPERAYGPAWRDKPGATAAQIAAVSTAPDAVSCAAD